MINEVTAEAAATAPVNLCEEDVVVGEELLINHTYTDLWQQMIILDMGVLVSLAGVSWMTQYLKEVDLTIEEMKSVRCQQPIRFWPSKRYVSETLVQLLFLGKGIDGREDVLVVQMYLVDAEVPFLCDKRTLEMWNFKIDSRRKILEIESKSDESRKEFRMIETLGGHYGIILET